MCKGDCKRTSTETERPLGLVSGEDAVSGVKGAGQCGRWQEPALWAELPLPPHGAQALQQAPSGNGCCGTSPLSFLPVADCWRPCLG